MGLKLLVIILMLCFTQAYCYVTSMCSVSTHDRLEIVDVKVR